jgi:hypothetical protein
MTEEAIDQAAEQSMTDKIASKFGFPHQGQAEAESAPETEGVESDLAELDWEGEKYRVPSKLKDAFMRNEDYTRKSQDLAEQRRSVEQVREIAQQAQVSAAFNDSIAQESQQLSVIDAYMQQATKVDWSQMSTDQMLRHKVEIDSVKEQRSAIVQALNEKRAKFQDEFKAKMSGLRLKSRELASKAISGFSEKTEAEMRTYAIGEGLTEAEVDNVFLDPRSYKVIYKAMQFDKVQANSGRAVEAATQADRVLRPGGAGQKMPADVAQRLNFGKAMKAAHTSGDKARVIEARLAQTFAKR